MPVLQKNHLLFDLVTWDWISDKSSEIRGQKRSLPESTEVSSFGAGDGSDELEDGLKVWGYMPGHVHYNLNQNEGEVRS